ncbi:hypothetical protein [Enterococcus sp. AZ177]|uniref:hypothetical protein n=1 Tax=unclassified Enterococcus TaxID=2608891 RepID=UPI003D2FC516
MKKRTFSFMYQPEYKKIIKELADGLEQVKILHRFDSKEERIRDTANLMAEATFVKLQSFVETEKKRLNSQMEKIKSSYKKTRNKYENPQEEILRRQDFDMSLSNLGELQVKAMLQEKDREFTEYELKKIMSHKWNDSSIKSRAKAILTTVKEPYTNDVAYQEAVSELAQLQLIDKPLPASTLLYVPSDNNSGYTTLGLSRVGRAAELKADTIELQADLNEAVKEMDGLVRTQTSSQAMDQLQDVHKQQKNESYTYTDFDSRVIPNSPDYDITHRFKYLRERYNDNTNDRFNATRGDYDIMLHLKWLEAQHDKKMKSDEEFSAKYNQQVDELDKALTEKAEKSQEEYE